VSEFEVRIMDPTRTLDAPVAPTEPTPEVRIQVRRGEAAGADAAADKTWQQWDDIYGPGKRPAAFTVEVKRL
jgi:hypothetical protein